MSAYLSIEARVAERDVEVSLSAAHGETLAIVGPNGAGKSTVLTLLAGLLRPDAGRIELDGATLAGDGRWIPPHRRGIVLMAQQTLLFPHLSVRDNVAFGPRASGLSRSAARDAAERWLVEVGVRHLAERRATDLSGGQAQRVSLARALAAEPAVLLLDEPTAALDVDAAPELRILLSRALEGRTAVLVSHDPGDVSALADRTVRMAAGRIIA
ncbi:ATP-binding cassette domain-containing protein [Microbacterium betulae]|uniref:ATP-binding cassette domain-containing protein n=1 Tax=Microbacterium betulae TaxID=2981139 RepID=A0AA97FJ98_9MICO|nr:ATP-binding cassette domain-containing protein [Microbacterium sp. AB]WOF23300.1 ATP-binding cassette domain-containing protein [Microbacterium sp. AB]